MILLKAQIVQNEDMLQLFSIALCFDIKAMVDEHDFCCADISATKDFHRVLPRLREASSKVP